MTSHCVTAYNIYSWNISWRKQLRVDHSTSNWSLKHCFLVSLYFEIQIPLFYFKKSSLSKSKRAASTSVLQLDEGRVVSTSPHPRSWGAGIWGWQAEGPCPQVREYISTAGLPVWGPLWWTSAGNIVLFLNILLYKLSIHFFSNLVSLFLVLSVWGEQLTPAGSEDLSSAFCPDIPEVLPWPAGLDISALWSISPR